jgi:LysR family transcriptional regulator, regulator for genes of the gallate degradation pathway
MVLKNVVPNLRHLRAFRSVAFHQSISRASEEVFLSQPAITQAIAKIEKSLNVRLFVRRTDGVYLTDAGKLYLKRTERADTYLRKGINEALALSNSKKKKTFTKLDQLISGIQMRALIAVSETGNFSLAARSINVSQPSLYRAARDLEKLSEMTLFTKSRRGIDLTPAARVWARYAMLAFAELFQVQMEIEELKGIDTGRIVIGTMPLARSYVLPTTINLFTRKRPGVTINVIDGRYEELLHGLRHGDIDMLIGALRNPPPIDDVVEEPIFDDSLALIVRAGHPLESRKNITIEDLSVFPWITPRPGSPTREKFDAIFAEHLDLRPKSIIEASSLVLIRGLLMDSDRITILSAHQVRQEKEWGLLAVLPFKLTDTRRPIGLTTRQGWHPTTSQSKFVDALRTVGRDVGKT